MQRRLVLVVLGEARDEGLDVVVVRRSQKPLDHPCGPSICGLRCSTVLDSSFQFTRIESHYGRTPGAVKQKRPYDSARRREQARQTRERIIDGAERRFLRDGYGPTTIAAIADDAAVSADTVYKSFGGKPGLVRAIRARALEGEGPVPAEQRSDELQARELDGRSDHRGVGCPDPGGRPPRRSDPPAHPSRCSERPEVAALLEEMDEDRLRRMTDNARRLGRAGHLRAGITVARAADVLWTYSAPELYELLVLRRGWTPARFSRFIVDAMIDALL